MKNHNFWDIIVILILLQGILESAKIFNSIGFKGASWTYLIIGLTGIVYIGIIAFNRNIKSKRKVKK
jgi:hypothetical protein